MANVDDDLEIINGDEADEDATDLKNLDVTAPEPEIDEEVVEGEDIDLKLLKTIPTIYTDIIAEFADVEIFMISLDSLLLELLSHSYHNFENLGGQTIVFAAQIECFLRKLTELRAKFKLVAFTDFTPLYNQDTILSFYYNFMIVYLQKHEKYHEDLEFFKNPLDVKYGDFLYRLTPSFLLMSIENASLDQSHLALENDFSKRFLSIAIHLISLSIPVMYFSSFTINFSSVMSYRLFTSVLKVSDMEKKIEAIWDKSYDLPQRKPEPTVYKSTAEFLTHITKEELKKGRDKEEDFPEICAAAIMSALVGMKRGVARNYLPAKQVRKGLALIRLRRALLQAIAIKLATIDTKCLNFPMEDLWDGRLILTIFEAIVGKEKILPFRIQQEFAEFHKLADLKVPIQTDEGDRLLDPPSPSTPRKLLIDDLELYSIDSRLVDEYVPEFNEIFANRKLREKPDVFYEDAFRAIQWQFNRIEMRIFQEEKKEKEKLKNLNTRQLKNANRKRQKLMLWYQNFADSLGGEFLVDFTRTPRTKIEEIDVEADSKNTKKGGAHKKGGKQAEPKKSKADLIKEQNLKKQQAKQFETEKNSIEFMMKLPGNALAHLEEQFKKLELAESKAYCTFVIVQKLADEFERQVQKLDLEEKRLTAVELVGKIKECFTTHWKNLDEKQKEKVNEIWMSLGFEPNPKKKGNTQMNLEIDLVNYQLYYGGRLIDIMSDPQKDERVTGFKPDNWQRDMIDAVDKFHSALIIAPTSAGKTFVSYYCMEKILRQSDEDVVVYVSPSNALSHQVCGSVYARFKNKSMSGGKNLFGTMTTDRSDNALNCQVLVVLPECLEQLLTSPDLQIQAFVSKIKYVILDEVHCINAADMRNESKGHIWEHIFLLIRCPFLALSATINNIDDMYNWLKNAEIKKSMPGTKPRQVELITYSERWSELELAMQKLTAGGPNAAKEIKDDWDTFCKNSKGLQADRLKKAIEEVSTIEEDTESRTSTPALRESTLDIRMSLLKFFTPFSMFKPEKIRLFGIPGDQLLTARQIAELYSLMSSIDEATKKQFAPTKYFKDAAERDAKERGLAEMDKVWLNRKILRDYEKALKEKFMDWLLNDELKSRTMFEKLEAEVEDELEYRSKPFDMNSTALYNIVPLMDDLKEKSMLPALCFNEDRSIIRRLAVRVFNELEKRESEFLRSSEFKKINFQKAEAKYEKLMKRKRDEAEKKKERKNRRGSDEEQEQEKEPEVDAEADAFAKQRSRLKEAMKRFKLLGPNPDEEMFNKTVERLMSGYAMEREDTKILYRLIERGIGYHYDGMNNAERGCVEILFRNGYLGIVFSTSTLALGMNMPCKTVIFGIDTNKLTPLQFRQMSGRAGRRGYDSAGTVIFMALPTSKTRRLLTASLATLRGNAPYTTSFLLRLFDYVNGWKDQEKSITEAKEKFKKGKIVDTTDTLNTEVRIKAALTLLDNCFALYTKDEAKRAAFNRLLKYLTLFNVQLLRREQLLNAKCELTGFAQVATALSSFEPGNLVFVHILQKGEFHKLCKKYAEEPKKLQDTLILILAHIFTNKRLPISYDTGDDSNKPALKPMPDEFQTLVDEYNSNVDKLLLAFLQLATEKRHLQSPVFELTGKIKEDSLDTAHLDVVSPFDEDLILDEKLMPAAARTLYDHRGNKIQMNSYAYDFWKNGSKDDLIKINKLSQLEYWYLIDNFSHVLIGIYSALFDVSKQRDKLLDVMREIADEYEDKFKKAFSMRSNIEETVTVEGKREKTKKWHRS